MSHELLFDASLFLFLLLIDRDIAARTHLLRCPHCGGVLDIANFHRKPRGCLCKAPEGFDVRYSLCCRSDGCRRRSTPASVRFLDRRVYLGIVTIIVGAMQHGTPNFRMRELRAKLGVDFHTIQSWKEFWTKLFPAGDGGKRVRAWLPEGGSADELLSTLWKKLAPAVATSTETAMAVGRMLVMVMVDGLGLGEKIIKQLSRIAYPQETPTDA